MVKSRVNLWYFDSLKQSNGNHRILETDDVTTSEKLFLGIVEQQQCGAMGVGHLETNNAVETMTDRAQLYHRILDKLISAPKKMNLAFLNFLDAGWNEKEGEYINIIIIGSVKYSTPYFSLIKRK